MRQRCRNWAVFTLWLMVMQSSAGYAAGNDGQRLLLVSHDQQALFVTAFVIAEEQQLNGQQLERLIRETVDVHVNAKVAIISLCFFARYSTGMPHSRTAQTWKPTPDLFPRPPMTTSITPWKHSVIGIACRSW